MVTCGNFHVARGEGAREVYETLVLWFDDDWIFDQCKSSPKAHLIGGLEPWYFLTFHSVGNVIIPTDEHIFHGGGSTTNQSQLGTSAYHVLDPELLMPKTS